MDAVEEVRVELGERSYTVSIGRGLLDNLPGFLPKRQWRKAVVVTDSNVGPLYAETAVTGLRALGLETVLLEMPAGESSKNADRALEVVEFLISSGLTRSDVLVALGGGVVGDLTGFAASVFKRGIDIVHVPTSLMAQVDSSIGGKTAVNVPAAKNLIGTFHQPVAVVSDVDLLESLSAREFRSGLAEVAKYSLLTAKEWGRDFREDATGIERMKHPRLAEVVAWCVREKAELVSADERDTGVRHNLNYGHTLGHALEAVGGYDGTYSHGEAISIGMVYAAIVSEELGLGRRSLARDHMRLLESFGLPVRPPDEAPGFDALALSMAQDKKSAGDNVMMLLEEEGKPCVRRGLDSALLRRCYDLLISSPSRGEGASGACSR
ncbi:MAG: 3-dehydroquinate synthase [Candidatus Anoxymicrobium japonicum]|uniref:3-dehydroquinate synthase n=1 Tax=Candidatus Anoxymicrobium japonicum TaxID=2013648 RepID=A0A2N3G742_9ACTN|nr:MAG: 3-dehydroquinate synthase [Candidatus Anoxymicrobium japonicum]